MERYEELAGRGLVHHNFLLIFINGDDLHGAGDQDVAASTAVAPLVDALAGSVGLHLGLRSKDGDFVIIEQ